MLLMAVKCLLQFHFKSRLVITFGIVPLQWLAQLADRVYHGVKPLLLHDK